MSAGTAKLLAHLWSPEPWGLPHVTGTGLGYVWRGDTRTTAEPALVLAHGPPRWHCWWAPEPWVSQLLGLSIAAYFLCCQPGTKEEWLHLWHPPGAGNQPRVRKAESGQEICNPGSFTQEEVVPFYQSNVIPVLLKILQGTDLGEPWCAPNSSYGNSCSFGVFAEGLRNKRWLPSAGMPPSLEDYSQHLGASQQPDGRVMPHRSRSPPASTDLWKLAHSLLLWTAISKLHCQACWRMSTTSPGLQLRPSDTWSGTSSQDVSMMWPSLACDQREKKGEKTKSNHFTFLTGSFWKLLVSALGTRQ